MSRSYDSRSNLGHRSQCPFDGHYRIVAPPQPHDLVPSQPPELLASPPDDSADSTTSYLESPIESTATHPHFDNVAMSYLISGAKPNFKNSVVLEVLRGLTGAVLVRIGELGSICMTC